MVGSGNIVHNLGVMDWRAPDAGTVWAQRFDEDARQVLTASPGDAVGLQDHPDFALAAPTPDHFIPMLYLAGLAAVAGQPADVLVDGYAYGSLSMASYTLGAGPLPAATGDGSAPDLPDAPSESTNI